MTIDDLRNETATLPGYRKVKLRIHLGPDPVSGKMMIIESDNIKVVEVAIDGEIGYALLGIGNK